MVRFMLLPDQRALLVTHCNDHPVAVCPQCSEALPVERLLPDLPSRPGYRPAPAPPSRRMHLDSGSETGETRPVTTYSWLVWGR
jgi:hypothetical protein